MGVVYSMYDALVSINVPSEKAKAVIDALEREMMERVATKADLEHFRDVLSGDIRATNRDLQHLRELVSRDLQAATRDMTIRLGTLSGVWAGILFALLKLTA